MGNQAISGLAALIVLTFLALALAACTTSEQPTQFVSKDAGQPLAQQSTGQAEFHGAAIGPRPPALTAASGSLAQVLASVERMS